MNSFGYKVMYTAVAVAMALGVCPGRAAAQDAHDRAMHQQPMSVEQAKSASALVDAVREATQRFQNVAVAQSEGYGLQFGCVSGSDVGAMGMHFVNGMLVGDGELDVSRPEIVLYEPLPNGRLQLTGADYLVLADAWNAKHADPPQLMGQLFHLFDAPNRFNLPAFYTLHVWAWKENPNGTFTNWNPNVSCEAFGGQQP